MRRKEPGAREERCPARVCDGSGRVREADWECLAVTSPPPERNKETMRLIDVSQVNVYGNVQVTTQALRELCNRAVPVSYFSQGGWFYGITHGHISKNVHLRIAQYGAFNDGAKSLEFARKIIHGKIKNCRTIIRRTSAKTGPPS